MFRINNLRDPCRIIEIFLRHSLMIEPIFQPIDHLDNWDRGKDDRREIFSKFSKTFFRTLNINLKRIIRITNTTHTWKNYKTMWIFPPSSQFSSSCCFITFRNVFRCDTFVRITSYSCTINQSFYPSVRITRRPKT